MNKIIDAAISHSRTVILLLILILTAGLVTYVNIPKESEPDINIPYIFVNVVHQGISPEDAERLIVKPLEQELRTVEGVKEMKATAFEGGAQVVLEFEAGFDSDDALDEVREQVDIAKPELPASTEEPSVDELNFSMFPIIVVTLSGDLPERSLLKIARNLQDELETIPTVLEVDIAGDRDEQVEIIIDPEMVDSYGISSAELSSFLARSNRLVAAGSLDNGKGRFSIKLPGLLEDVQDIMELPIKTDGDAVITLSDIAKGRRGFDDPEGYARINGKPTIGLEVSKRTGENLIDTVKAVKKIVEREQEYWPENLKVEFSQDKSKDIKNMLSDLQNSVITAVILVMILVIAALGTRSGLLVGVSIPGSFLMAILVLGSIGYTLNIIVLFSLILAVGMLVDGAIVITEYADRKMSEGLDKKEAYAKASKRMAWPVIASTATTLAAFAPLIFWTGVLGEFMKYMPITLIFTLTASLLMALIFVPTLGSIFGKVGDDDVSQIEAIKASEDGDISEIKGFTGRYAKLLEKALKRPGKIVSFAVIALICSWVLYGIFGAGVELFPDIEPEQSVIRVHARGNLSVEEKDAFIREVEEEVLDISDIETVYARSGHSDYESSEDVIGMISLYYKDWDERRESKEIIEQIKQRTKDYAGIFVEVREEREGPTKGKPIEIELASRDYQKLFPAVSHIKRGMDEVEDFIDVEDSLPLPGIQWEMDVDRAQAAKFGVDISSIGDMVQLVTQGLKFSDYRPDDSEEEIDIVARYPEKYRSITQLEQIRVTTQKGQIPISNFIKLVPAPRVSNINRTDGKRVMTVKADVKKGVLVDDKLKEFQVWLKNNPLDKTVSIKYKGDDEEQRKTSAFLSKAFSIALFVMAIILVTQFNSFYSAFLILTSVVLSTIGVMLGLLVMQQPFGLVMNGIGVISLAGIVVNNNIVLIDTYDIAKKRYSTAVEAAIRTGVQRLRPVMLTTITTILGLLPMMFKLNIDFIKRDVSVGAPSMQWWSQLATSIVCGLAFATVLTLVVTPCALVLWANFIDWFNKKYNKNIPI